MIIVAPHLYERARKLILTRTVRRVGLHVQCAFEEETWWEIHKLPKKRPFIFESLIRVSEYDDWIDNGPKTLPQAMKKRGYFVRLGKIQHL